MNPIDVEKISDVIQIAPVFSQLNVENDVSIVNVDKIFSIAFEDQTIPNFVDNEQAISAGLKRFELWRSPDNKINIVKYTNFITGFNVNLSRALSYLRRLF